MSQLRRRKRKAIELATATVGEVKDILREAKACLAGIPEVDSAYAFVDESGVSISILVDVYERRVRERIYDVYDRMLAEHTTAEISFRVLAKPCNQPATQIISDATPLYERQTG